jgi:hypothetical protein
MSYYFMKKSKEIIALDNELLKQMETLNDVIQLYQKKIKKEASTILIEEKIKLLQKIADNENLDLNYLKSKYLKSKELLSFNNLSVVNNNNTDSEELLDKVEINGVIYYYENKEKGKVYNSDYNEVGIFKSNSIILNN